MNQKNCYRCKFSMFNWDYALLFSPSREIPKRIDCYVHGEKEENGVALTSQQMAQIFNRGCASFQEMV